MARLDTISQYSNEIIGIAIIEGNTPVDPDGNLVTLSITRKSDNIVVVDAQQATRDELSMYSFVLPLAVTATKDEYSTIWLWQVNGEDREFGYSFAVVDPQPYFDSLDDDQKVLVDNVYHAVSDAFDSEKGGPYLWELPQSSFSFETIARLMVVDAMTLINFSGPKAFIPPFTVGAQSDKPFPLGWYGLLQKATRYELFKHLATSYLEIPDPVGVEVARLDRQAYFDKWIKRAEMEFEELEHMIKMLKRDMRFGVTSRSMLLAGGIFPISYLNPARPRWPYVLSRFYAVGPGMLVLFEVMKTIFGGRHGII